MSLSLIKVEEASDADGAGLLSTEELALSEAGALDLSERFEEREPEALIRWAIEAWGGELALVTSFQAEGLVLLDMALAIDPRLRVITLDTGRLPAETYQLVERVRERYGVDIEVFFPNAEAVQALVRGAGLNLFYQSVEARLRCCQVRKVEPMGRALNGVQAWLTGLRRDQTASRSGLGKVELDRRNPGKVKLSPLASWTSEQVWEYIREHRVPYHSLYDRGYTSIGCAPCTRPTAAGEAPRAGRWWWEKGGASECGLHWRKPGTEEPQISLDLLQQRARIAATAKREASHDRQ